MSLSNKAIMVKLINNGQWELMPSYNKLVPCVDLHGTHLFSVPLRFEFPEFMLEYEYVISIHQEIIEEQQHISP